MAHLGPEKGGRFADLTFDGGGLSRAILEASPEVLSLQWIVTDAFEKVLT